MSTKELPKPPYTATNKPTEEYISYNGARFYTEFWVCIKTRSRIVWLHGFSEYSKVYVRIFDQLSQEGYEIFFFDQRGAGFTSPGKLKGLTDEFHTFDDLDYFLKKNIDEIANRDNKRLYLMGHSMGGGISLNYGVKGKYKDHLSGIAVTGPLILLHVSLKFVFS
ncbi:Serine hydrolase [Wickerhamomyces ciferrii]|uniref:Serine hydrolase n=1 Tax=Wickerhamomyces ciferrii (strain ATCC 14091 / BCRC 22168 / CBS 111 / JCM 3599 / NBRC 0793 / NRRL Y-1031 F-60-10) TaxID=1206466 RepID=K0KXV8_WICCF|nr:Serine hydrolase [Wickerhamomyces ciferrii]CCH45913.1 Serine hydrolase [Wickerhamomyces ciferrii]